MEDLLARHRKESRELQNKITSKKKNATKKTRKGVNDECAELERALKERHAAELVAAGPNGAASPAPLADGAAASAEPDLASSIADLSVRDPGASAAAAAEAVDTEEPVASGGGPKRKGNRQKARLARRAADQEGAAERAAAEATDMPDLRARERDVVDRALRERGLVEHEVRSDGHCLYAAMADQLAQVGVSLDGGGDDDNGDDKGAGGEELPGYKAVRAQAAKFVLSHQDDFVPFLDEEDLLNGGVEGYARKISDTAEWGGQMEIMACARRWGLVVNVLQGDGRVERIEGTSDKKSVEKECWLAYYRHSFGLGEHYNSLRRQKAK